MHASASASAIEGLFCEVVYAFATKKRGVAAAAVCLLLLLWTCFRVEGVVAAVFIFCFVGPLLQIYRRRLILSRVVIHIIDIVVIRYVVLFLILNAILPQYPNVVLCNASILLFIVFFSASPNKNKDKMSINPTSEPFIPGTIPFSQYQEQLEWMFEHNNYTEDRYKTSFLAVCGTEVFSQLKLLFPGQSLRELTYKQITDKLKQRYDKKDSDVIHSYRFWTRRQGQYEKAVDFVLDVKHLAEQCEFGDFKSRAIRDVLVIGLNDRGLQKRLFDEDDLTAAKAEKIIVNQELASDRTLILSTDDDKKTWYSSSFRS